MRLVPIHATTLLAVCLPMVETRGQAISGEPVRSLTYRVVDTGQTRCFGDRGQLLEPPRPGTPFFGQDAFYSGPQPSYRDNGDGTVSDLNTGLMWQKAFEAGRKHTLQEARAAARSSRLGGHDDWRLPTIKELYSLIDFNGNSRARPPVPYIDTRVFEFRFGDESAGERLIDAQYLSSTEYVGRTMRGNATVFGVNFADGRIKGYPRDFGPRGPMRQFVRLVRGNPEYGKNRLVDNKDGTVSDLATGLMWARADSGRGMNWRDALNYCETLTLAGHDDWRLPSAKELQSLVDYTRAPDARDAAHRGPAIDPVFRTTDPDASFWSSTTHLEGPGPQGGAAAYVAFGRAMGYMTFPGGSREHLNVHGAGAQRSDPKNGDPQSPRWASGLGPQGDEIRILNFARPVRSIDPTSIKLVRPDVTPIQVAENGPPGPDGPGPDAPEEMPRGTLRPGGPAGAPGIGNVIPPFVRGGLDLTAPQRRQIGELEADVRERLEKILTPEQIQRFRQLLRRGPGDAPGGPPDDDGPPGS